jgi:hypothetical protein
MKFRKSSYSASDQDCVEVAELPDRTRLVRDSKNPTGPVLQFSADAWHRFTERAKAD